MRRSKYPSLGILDAIHQLIYGFSSDGHYYPSREEISHELYQSGIPKRVVSKRISFLSSKGYLSTSKNSRLHLTKKGKTWLSFADVSHIMFRNKRMDRYQRLIIFDIPEERRDARNILRRKLKEFECKLLQKSVYLTPYICEQEINEIARILNIESYVHLLKVIPF